MNIGANKQRSWQGDSRLTFLPRFCPTIQDRMELMLLLLEMSLARHEDERFSDAILRFNSSVMATTPGSALSSHQGHN